MIVVFQSVAEAYIWHNLSIKLSIHL